MGCGVLLTLQSMYNDPYVRFTKKSQQRNLTHFWKGLSLLLLYRVIHTKKQIQLIQQSLLLHAPFSHIVIFFSFRAKGTSSIRFLLCVVVSVHTNQKRDFFRKKLIQITQSTKANSLSRGTRVITSRN